MDFLPACSPVAPGAGRPLIALVPDWLPQVTDYTKHPAYLLRRNYLGALRQAGGLPVVIDYHGDIAADYVQHCHGLVLIGGDHTIDPQWFGQPNVAKLPLNPTRVDAEVRLFQGAFAAQMPILGICAGMQLMAVLLGGSLVQDLPTQRPQSLNHKGPHTHPIRVTPGSQLWQATGQPQEMYAVNTWHQQAVDQVGPHTRISAQALDGVIEAIEAMHHPFCLGLQWHPEFSCAPHPDALLFENFVQACHRFAHHRANE